MSRNESQSVGNHWAIIGQSYTISRNQPQSGGNSWQSVAISRHQAHAISHLPVGRNQTQSDAITHLPVGALAPLNLQRRTRRRRLRARRLERHLRLL